MRALYICISSFVLLVAGWMHGYSQAPSVETMQQMLRKAASDTARIRLYHTLSYIVKPNEQKIAYADSALTIAVAHHDSANISKAFFNISNAYWLGGSFDKALDNGIRAEKYLPAGQKGSDGHADILFLLANINNRLSRNEPAINYYSRAEQIVRKQNDKRLLPRIYNNRGVAYMNNGDLDKALDSYRQALQLFEQKSDTTSCFSAFRNIAIIYHDLGQDDKQLEYLSKSLHLAEKKKDPVMLSETYSELGRFYLDRGNKELAKKYFEKLLEIPQPEGNKYHLTNIYGKLSSYYKNTGNKSLAFQYQLKALAISKEMGAPKVIASTHNALSELYQAENLSDSSIYHANQAYTIAAESGNTKTQAIASLRLSQYHQQKKEIQKAIEYAEVAYNKALEVGYLQLARDAASQLGNLYESSGKYKESNGYIRKYHTLSDSLQRMENTRKIAHLSSQMEYEKREAELKTKIDRQQHKLRSRNWLFGLTLCILALTGALAYTSRRSAIARKKTNAVLHDQKEELEAFNEELAATNEELSTVNDELKRTYEELERYRDHLEEIVRDKTAKLREALQQAQESDVFKAAFFANMSHEIRTPLNAILGFLQFIDDPSIEPDKRQEMIELINANARQLLQMVDDIVTLSKIDSGLLSIQPGQFSINGILNEVMSEALKIVKDAGKEKLELVIENRLPETVHSVIVDGRQIELVLLHLIHNAVKFTERGFVAFGCEKDENLSLLRFFVEDTGIGISDDHQKLIFKRFWKKGDHYTQEFRGIGIGLSLCEELVRLMGGTFSVESTPGQGSIFRFTVTYERSL